ncbi:DDE_3 domain-containing protein [Trichonephila clavipes]|nr:DDE_3 domain-containing protein [Trichonephila clavipes]
MSCVHSDGRGQLQQDNAPPHRSIVITEWTEEHSSEFRTLSWLPNFPDVNIIKHIWDALQRLSLRDLHQLTLP